MSFLECERIGERCVSLRNNNNKNNFEKFNNLKKIYIKLAGESTQEINEEYQQKIENLKKEKVKTMKHAESYWRGEKPRR